MATKTSAASAHPMPAPVPEPEWLKQFVSEEESFLVTKLARLNEEIAERMKARDEVAKSMQGSQTWKQLFITTGETFRAWTKSALEELGMLVENGPKGHAELIGRYGDLLVTIEAKAINTAARKPDIGQAADYADEIEQALEFTGDELSDHHREYLALIEKLGFSTDVIKSDKGLVRKVAILNTSKNEPLDKRAVPAFPAAASSEMKNREVAGLTGVQLFGILSACRAGRIDKAKVLKEILATSGQFKDFQNWQTFLTPKSESYAAYSVNP
jgi:hypothetical protein